MLVSGYCPCRTEACRRKEYFLESHLHPNSMRRVQATLAISTGFCPGPFQRNPRVIGIINQLVAFRSVGHDNEACSHGGSCITPPPSPGILCPWNTCMLSENKTSTKDHPRATARAVFSTFDGHRSLPSRPPDQGRRWTSSLPARERSLRPLARTRLT